MNSSCTLHARFVQEEALKGLKADKVVVVTDEARCAMVRKTVSYLGAVVVGNHLSGLQDRSNNMVIGVQI